MIGQYMEKQPWLNILGKSTAGNMQPCEKFCAADQFGLFFPKKHFKKNLNTTQIVSRTE